MVLDKRSKGINQNKQTKKNYPRQRQQYGDYQRERRVGEVEEGM